MSYTRAQPEDDRDANMSEEMQNVKFLPPIMVVPQNTERSGLTDEQAIGLWNTLHAAKRDAMLGYDEELLYDTLTRRLYMLSAALFVIKTEEKQPDA